MVDNTHQDIDAATGTATTGHEWDGIKELNTPLPKWWLYILYACMVWAVGYWFLYPAIPLPGGHTPGLLGWTSRGAVTADLQDLQAQRAHPGRPAEQVNSAADRRRSEAGGIRPRLWPLVVRRELRAVPWLERPGFGRLSQSHGRPLAVGRQA